MLTSDNSIFCFILRSNIINRNVYKYYPNMKMTIDLNVLIINIIHVFAFLTLSIIKELKLLWRSFGKVSEARK